MINNITTHKLLFRDGTSQQDRKHKTLQPGYVQVEDRSMEALVAEAQRLAKELQFFDEENKPVSTWEAFLIDDPEAYYKKSLGGREIQKKEWAAQLAAYVEDPGRFRNDKEMLARLSRPHSVLFMTFLKLLNHVKSQINGLTQKHLDFYFRERLGLTQKDAVPDVVNVLLELTEDIDKLEVKEGTILLAGEDEEGNELQYKVDEDTIISQARIAALKNVFADKKIRTISDAHINHIDTPDQGFTAMMEMALGDPNPGDPLPPFPNGITDLSTLYIQTQQNNTDATGYVSEQLFLSIEDFNVIMQRHLEDMNAEPVDWQSVYTIADRAFKNKFKKKRQGILKDIHQAEGFDSLLKHVYGNPLPGDSLPLYQGNPPSFADVYQDKLNPDADINQKASDYITEELRLAEQDFIHIVQTNNNQTAGEEAWDKVYKILELADRKVRSTPLPTPAVEELSDIYATSNAKANAFSQYGDEEESKRFKTFGSKHPGVELPLQPAALGFAISSPALSLREGKRQITTLIDLGIESNDIDALQSLFDEQGFPPFQVYLSSEDQWVPAENTSFVFGNHLGANAEGTYLSTTLNGQILTVTDGGNFTSSDVGKYLVVPGGTIYEIIAMNAQNEVMVQEAGTTDSTFETMLKFPPEQVYLNALKVVIELSGEDAPVLPFNSADKTSYIRSEHPALVFSLHHIPADQQEEKSYISRYQNLMHLNIHKVHLSVAVEGMKNISLQNDQNTIDARKSFEPFGTEPETGSNFYLANEEISRKRLDKLELELQWLKQPVSFSQHYDSYWKIQADDPNLPETDDAYRIKGNDNFKAQVFFHDNNSEIPMAEIALFPEDGKTSISSVPGQLSAQSPAYQYSSSPDTAVSDEDVIEWDRYFRLELEPLDFQHSIYNGLFNRQALSTDPNNTKSLIINPPYQPKLKSLKIGYAAHTDIVPGEAGTTSHDKLYHIHPFGFQQLKEASPDLLPAYTHQGTLYLGLVQLEAPQILSILFQMAAGSADPDIEKPQLQWSYLRDNEWIVMEQSAILSDTTNGLLNTGIVRIKIPSDISTGGSLMPDTLSWLKISAAGNITGISDTINVMTQAISATLSGKVVAPSHFESLLPAASITETQDPVPEIKTIIQPFTSRKGKPAEDSYALYKRISERIRHKNRALSLWDYEHIVLNEFPEVYKVKCLPGDSPGKVEVIVIPDIRGRLPFNPFAPKVAADTLFQIGEYLDTHSSPYAEIEVQNPFYLQVKTRCVVKFHSGYDEGFYKATLIDEIKRFLAPWAYDATSDIRIGGSLHGSVLINFIAERPYIDYVANLKLFQSEDGKKFTDVRSLNDGKTIVVPSRPDMIMVSAQSHEIDIVDENGYDEDNFEGINYMKVELDLIVGEDPI